MESLSVIVTTHNCAAVVQRTLQSVATALAFLRQSAGQAAADGAEIIVVDDGSADSTPQLVAEFAAGRPGWKVVRRDKPSSPSCARNTGVCRATGELLFFLDGDDLFLPEHLAACRSALLSKPAADFIKTGVRLADPVHPDWRERIANSLIINLAIRRRCHEAFGGFLDYHLFRRKGDGFEHLSDLFFKYEDMFYNQLAQRLFQGMVMPQETVEYCRYPGNSFDRQYAKFCRPFAGAAPSENGDRLRLQLCEAIAQDRAEQLLRERGPAPVAEALQRARRHRAAKEWKKAEAECRQLLKAHPQEAEGWQLLGACCQALDQPAEAEKAYRAAVRLRPDDAEVQFALGSLQDKRGRRKEAMASYRQIIQVRPDHAEARVRLGIALAERGELDEAIAQLRAACCHAPGLAKAHNNLGVALAQRGLVGEAVAAFQEALRLQPDYAAAAYGLGNALGTQRRHAAAVVHYRTALRLQPDFPEAHNNLGLALLEIGALDEAVVVLRQGVRLRPKAAEAHNNLGLALAALGQFAAAETCYEEALRLKPGYAEAHNNLASAYKEQMRLGEALASYDAALRLESDSASAHWNRSLALLQGGDFERGWAEYEWRWRRSGSKPRQLPKPAWDGTRLAGRTLLVYAEQGWGDMMQFLRYAPLAARTGGRVVVECPAPLAPLFATCAGIERVVVEGEPLPAFDCHAALLSLPRLMKTTLATVPAVVPYLSATAERVAAWGPRLPQGVFKIGVVWQGNPRHRWDRHRSVPLTQLAPLAQVPGVQLISLQKGAGSEQVAEAAGVCPVLVLDGLDEDGGAFLDTAAVLKHLDLVVTVDTALAHLAGALGVPVWLALSVLADWRWLREREDTPWYPGMRLFRQRTLGAWDEVFQRMAGELRQRCAVPREGKVRIDVSPGELLDKLTILEIKAERIVDAGGRAHVAAELALLGPVWAAVPPSPELARLRADLKSVNETLWQVEDEVRVCERDGEFGARFVELARSVYRHNDARAALKREVNKLLKAPFHEQKIHPAY
jgi:tetratricopeptide (TPR) repeat protein